MTAYPPSRLDSPAYYFVIFCYMFIASNLVTTTPWSLLADDLAACRKYWWQNLFYVQNLRPGDPVTSCYLPSW